MSGPDGVLNEAEVEHEPVVVERSPPPVAPIGGAPMKSVPALVRAALAHHLDCDPGKIHTRQHLQADLDLTPLELIVIALEIEELVGVAIPVEALDDVATVGDFLSFMSHAVAHQRANGTAVAALRRSRHGAMSP
jgi:acyl carrier protein